MSKKEERFHANLEICRKLMEFFSKNQDIRFFQGLQILGLQNAEIDFENDRMIIKNNFSEESLTTLNKLKE
jgi:hypothetical protein